MTYQNDLDLVLAMAARFASEGAIADNFSRDADDPAPADVEAAIARLRADPSILGVTLGDLLSVASYADEFVTDWREDEGLEPEDRERASAAADVVDRVQANLPAAWKLLTENRPAPAAVAGALAMKALKNASGAMGAVLHQVGQMRGMFDDEDGTIQDAVDACDEAQDECEAAIAALEADKPEPITVAVTISGGVLQWAGADRPGAALIVVDYDQDGVDEGELVDMAAADAKRAEWAQVRQENVTDDTEFVAHIVAKLVENTKREELYEAGKCVGCEGDNDRQDNDEGTGLCSLCNGGGE